MTTPEAEQLNTEPVAVAEVGPTEACEPTEQPEPGEPSEPSEASEASEATDAPTEPEAAPVGASAEAAPGSEPEQATEAAGKRRRKPRPVDVSLPGMEERDIEELVQLAQTVIDREDEIAEGRAALKTARINLIRSMIKHGRERYSYRGLEIDLTEKVDVKVRAKRESADVRKHAADGCRHRKRCVERQSQPEPIQEESLANAEAFLTGNAAPEGVEISTEPGQDSTIEAKPSPETSQDEENESRAKYAGAYEYDQYVAYAKFLGVKMAKSWAEKWRQSGEKDGMVKAWLAEGLETANERKAAKATAPKSQPEPKRRDRRNHNRCANA